jgi:hypothetical protein
MNIEFLSEDLEQGTHTFRCEFAGRDSKDEHIITIDMNNTLFLVDGRGGRGGDG